jgi:hypothetical protein
MLHRSKAAFRSSAFYDKVPYIPLKDSRWLKISYPPSESKRNKTKNEHETGRKLAYSSVLKMDAICSFETSVEFYYTTRCFIPEDSSTLHNHGSGKPKSNEVLIFYVYGSSVKINHIIVRFT